MAFSTKIYSGMLVVGSLLLAGIAHADTFGTGSNQFSIAFSEMGYPGNIGDTNHSANGMAPGAVDYVYRIGTYEVRVDQFFKALAADRRIADADEDYWNDGVRTVGVGAPVAYCSWYEGARFANWLTSGDAYNGAYQFDTNGTLVAVDRDAAMIIYGTIYVLPSEDEWFKAAYYKPADDGSYSRFTNGSDSTAPPRSTSNGWNYAEWGTWDPLLGPTNYLWESGSGGLEQNGTYDMNGNSWDWCENAHDGVLDVMAEDRVIRGGGYYETSAYMTSSHRHGPQDPAKEDEEIGLRMVAIESFYSSLDVSVEGSGSVNFTNGWYITGTNLSIEATPDTNWLFMGWSGDITGDYTMASTNLLVDTNTIITATFSDDADSDGLLNSAEDALGTNPRDPDSDGDTMPDIWEVEYGLDATTNNAAMDDDADGLTNLAEFVHSTNPTNSDSDADGLLDGSEVLTYGTDPLDGDTDGDAMPDGWEVSYSLDPLTTNALADADADAHKDLYEFAVGGDPTNGIDVGILPTYVVVTNGGTNYVNFIHARRTNAAMLGLSHELQITVGSVTNSWTNSSYVVTGTASLSNGFGSVTNRLDHWDPTTLYLRVAVSSSNAVVYSAITKITPLDLWVGSYGLYGTNALATADPDTDGLDNVAEFDAGTNPIVADTDADGLSDGSEVNTHATNPLVPDSDADGLSDEAEVVTYGTNPTDSDSDGDSLNDGAELITHGTDPLEADTDSDSFDDGLELANGGDPLVSDLWRVDYIRNNGAEYDLYSSNSVVDISLGQAIFSVTNGEATLSLQLEQSDDLITWSNAGDAVIWTIPVDASNTFYRVRSGHE